MAFLLKNPPSPACLRLLPLELMQRYSVLPVEYDGNTGCLTVAMPSASDLELVQELQMATGNLVQPVEADPDNIAEWVQTFAAQSESTFAAKQENGKAISAVARLVDEIISEAMQTGVSDIHFEPGEKVFLVRFRKDGELQIVRKLPVRLISETVSRIKIMASMDIAEHRRPQDGRIHFGDGNKAVDIRVSALPTDYGQKMVLRLLDKGQIIHRLDSLGMLPNQIEMAEEEIHKPYGMFLITGPTGSGKTTTLYTLLQMIRSSKLNISTIEEPIEYKLDGITQTAVNTKIDLTFAAALRTLLRQDPDVIMVGEIRDSETAELAIRAALTGHLVFSTLHTNDAPSAIARLIDMGVEPFLVASAVNFIMAQRLVRRICPKCGGKDSGCLACGGSGYKGRVGIFEMMKMSETLRDRIHENVSTSDLRKLAVAEGMKTLAEDGLEKVKLGLTTESEIAAEAVM